ncbi:MAG: hypothetical protein ACKVE4_01525 [Dissulfuribacterales bacterium]
MNRISDIQAIFDLVVEATSKPDGINQQESFDKREVLLDFKS